MKLKDIFSVTNNYAQNGISHKVINVCGIKIKLKRKSSIKPIISTTTPPRGTHRSIVLKPLII